MKPVGRNEVTGAIEESNCMRRLWQGLPKWNVLAVQGIFLAIILVFSLNVIWLNDDQKYAFIFRGPVFNSYEPIENAGDLLESNIIRYCQENGRIVVHLFVQGICAIGSHWLFAALNGIAFLWLLKMILRGAGVKRGDWRQWLAVGAMIIIFTPTQPTPSRMLNYPWLMALTLWYVEIYLGKKEYRGRRLWMLGISGVLLGNGHEGITVAIGAGMVVKTCVERWKLSRKEWVMSLCYLAGFLTNVLAPGTLTRTGLIKNFLLLDVFYSLVVSGPIIILAMIAIWNKLRYGTGLREFIGENYFWLVAIAAFYGLNWIQGWFTVRQGLFIGYMGIMLIMKNCRGRRLSPPWLAVSVAGMLIMTAWQWKMMTQNKKEYIETREAYMASEDGRVYYDYYNMGMMREINYAYTLYPPHHGFPKTDMQLAMDEEFPEREGLMQYPAGARELMAMDTLAAAEIADYDFNRLITFKGDGRQHAVAIDKRKPATLAGERKLLGFLRIDRFVNDNWWPVYRGKNVDIYYINDLWPMWVITKVELIEPALSE